MTDIFIGQATEQDGYLGMNEAAETLMFKVLLDDFSKGQDDACQVSGIPVGFSLHPTIPWARLRKKTATRQGNSCVWFVKCEYTTPDNNTGEEQENDDPELDIATMSVSFEDREEVLKNTLGGTRVAAGGIKNSAGEVFNPPPTKSVSSVVLEITQNYAATYAVLTTALSYMDCINSDTFLGCDPHTVRLCSVSPKSNVRNGTAYLEIGFVFKVRPTWDLELLDIGSYYLDADGKQVAFEYQGHPKQGLLDGSGHALASGAPDYFLPAKQIYTAKAFSSLSLPTSLSGYKFI